MPFGYYPSDRLGDFGWTNRMLPESAKSIFRARPASFSCSIPRMTENSTRERSFSVKRRTEAPLPVASPFNRQILDEPIRPLVQGRRRAHPPAKMPSLLIILPDTLTRSRASWFIEKSGWAQWCPAAVAGRIG
jgi:hypothetical protein